MTFCVEMAAMWKKVSKGEPAKYLVLLLMIINLLGRRRYDMAKAIEKVACSNQL